MEFWTALRPASVRLYWTTSVVTHHTVATLGHELGRRGKAVFLEEPGEELPRAARFRTYFQLAPLVQGLVAVPDPAREPAAVALAHAPAERVIAERDGVAVGARDARQLPGPVPGVTPYVLIGDSVLDQIIFRVVLVTSEQYVKPSNQLSKIPTSKLLLANTSM